MTVQDLDPSLFSDNREGKFKPKLTFDERCAILALVASGVHRNYVAQAYAVDRRTVSHVVNDHSPHYKSVRVAFRSMGKDAFVTRYLTPDAVEKMKAVKEAPALPGTNSANNARAKGKAGFHTVKPDQCAYPHRIEIAFHDGGWRYRDMDSSDPDTWLNNGPESMATSQACYAAMYNNLLDD